MLSESNSHNNRSILKRLKRVRLDDSVSRTMGIDYRARAVCLWAISRVISRRSPPYLDGPRATDSDRMRIINNMCVVKNV